MATGTRSGNGLATLVLIVVAILGVGWFMGSEDDGAGIERPVDINDEDYRKITMVINWSRPVKREVDVTWWINGKKHEDPQDESHNGQWIHFFGAMVGDKVRLLGENTAQGGYISCHIFESTRDGTDTLVKEQIRMGDAGDCDITHRVGDPPDVAPIE